MTRKIIDCRETTGSTCTVTIEGSEAEVSKLAMRHAVEDHKYKDGPELRSKLMGMMHDV